MLKPLILQTQESLKITVNTILENWLRGYGPEVSSTVQVAAQKEWHETLERVARMPPVPGDPSMMMLAKVSLLSAANEALKFETGVDVNGPSEQSEPDAVCELIIRDCARAWVYAEGGNPATLSFSQRIQQMEDAIRLHCSMSAEPSVSDSDSECAPLRRVG